MTDLDPAAIMVKHQVKRPTFLVAGEWWCPACNIYLEGGERCLPYRLAADLSEANRKLAATRAVLGYREQELLKIKGPCRWSGCTLHYAHSGPCDIAELGGDHE